MTQGIPSDSFNVPSLRNVRSDEAKETSQKKFLRTDPQPSTSDRIPERYTPSPKGRGQAGGRDLEMGGGMRAEKVTERGKGGAYKR